MGKFPLQQRRLDWRNRPLNWGLLGERTANGGALIEEKVMGLVSDMVKNQSAQKWRNAGDDKIERRAVRKAAYGNPSRPSKRFR